MKNNKNKGKNIVASDVSMCGVVCEILDIDNCDSLKTAWEKLCAYLDNFTGGGGDSQRFGIEDNVGIQDRNMDMEDFNFSINNVGIFDLDSVEFHLSGFSTGAGYILTDVAGDGNLTLEPSSVSNISLSAIGSSPNANSATLLANVLNMEPASIGFGGVLSPPATAQVIGGKKTFTQNTIQAFNIDGAWTASANNQFHFEINPSITARATVSDSIIAVKLDPIITSAALGQNLIGFYINPTYADSFSGKHYAIQEAGDIVPITTGVNNIGGLSLAYATGYITAWHGTTATLRSGTSMVFNDENSNVNARIFSSAGLTNYNQVGIQVGSSTQSTATSNGFVGEFIGAVKAYGEIIIARLTQPVISSVVPNGTTGATTYTYKVVALLADGISTEASAAVSTTTGNATLSGSNYNRITFAEVPGANKYFVYRTVGGATQGKIGTVIGGLILDDTGLAGDASIASTVNATGNLQIPVGGNLLMTEGTNGRVGQTTLVAGTKTITINGITTNSRAFPGFVAQGGTSTGVFQYSMVCTANTLTITAVTVAGVTVATDTSTINYLIIN